MKLFLFKLKNWRVWRQLTQLQKDWLSELVTKPHLQTKNWLRDGDKFCCLGKLCDVIDPNGWTKHSGVKEFDGYSTVLPEKVTTHPDLRWLSNDAGRLGGKVSLANMNDSGKTWPEIAQYVMDNADKFFGNVKR